MIYSKYFASLPLAPDDFRIPLLTNAAKSLLAVFLEQPLKNRTFIGHPMGLSDIYRTLSKFIF